MELLRGVISNLKIERRCADFVLSQTQHDQMATAAVGATFVGLGAQAIGVELGA